MKKIQLKITAIITMVLLLLNINLMAQTGGGPLTIDMKITHLGADFQDCDGANGDTDYRWKVRFKYEDHTYSNDCVIKNCCNCNSDDWVDVNSENLMLLNGYTTGSTWEQRITAIGQSESFPISSYGCWEDEGIFGNCNSDYSQFTSYDNNICALTEDVSNFNDKICSVPPMAGLGPEGRFFEFQYTCPPDNEYIFSSVTSGARVSVNYTPPSPAEVFGQPNACAGTFAEVFTRGSPCKTGGLYTWNELFDFYIETAPGNGDYELICDNCTRATAHYFELPGTYGIRVYSVAANDVSVRSTNYTTGSISIAPAGPVTIECPADTAIYWPTETIAINGSYTFPGDGFITSSCGNFMRLDLEVIEGCSYQGYTISRTYNAVDAVGNVQASCMQFTEVLDTVSPFVDAFFFCGDSPFIFDGTGTESITSVTALFDYSPEPDSVEFWDYPYCVISGFEWAIYHDVLVDDGCIDGTMNVERHWTLDDGCGNQLVEACVEIIEVNLTGSTLNATASPGSQILDGCGSGAINIANTGFELATTSTTVVAADFPGTITTCSSANPTVVYIDVITDDDCPSPNFVVERTWTVTDDMNNISVTTQSFSVVDNVGVSATCDGDIGPIEACDETGINAATAGFDFSTTATDISIADFPGSISDLGGACAATTASYIDVIQQSNCPNPILTVMRTWTISNACGSSSTCDQIITIQDGTPPILDDTNANDLTIACTSGIGTAITGEPTVSDNCSSPTAITLQSSDVSTQGTSACSKYNYQITRTWSATDACGNMASYDQIINIIDTIPPVIDDANVADQSLVCGSSTLPMDTGMPTAVDACSTADEIAITHTDQSTQGTEGCSLYAYTITRTWQATDACGNTAYDTQTIVLSDTTKPVMDCTTIPTVTIECDRSTDPTAVGAPTASDDCSLPEDIAFSFEDSSNQGTIGCAKYEYTITRTWEASDACGNTSTCSQIIQVVDNTAPVADCTMVNNVNISCDENTDPSNTGMLAVTDNCAAPDDITTAFTDQSTQSATGCGQYNYTITRSWTAVDACDNSTSCTQTIIVADLTPPSITAPDDWNGLACLTDQPAAADNINSYLALSGATALDNCASTDELTVSFVDQPSHPALLDYCSAIPADRTITRTYTIIDICGNSSTTSQAFIYNQSTILPTVKAPAGGTINCSYNAMPNENGVAVNTDCALGYSMTVDGPFIEGEANCPGTSYTYTYTVEDACGRTVSDQQIFTVANEGPEFVCSFDVCRIDCPADVSVMQTSFAAFAELAVVNTTCNGGVNIVNDFSPNNFIPQNCNDSPVAHPNTVAYQVVTFTATDQCNRSSTCTALVVVSDNTIPTISGATFDAIRYDNALAQSEYESWVQDNLDLLSTLDECNAFAQNPTWSYAPTSPNTEFSGPFATSITTFTATDACGNSASTTATFRLKEEPVSPLVNVSGTILTASLAEVENVSVRIQQADLGIIDDELTNEEGSFAFDMETEQNYEVIPYRNDDPRNGVSTMDLLVMSWHILGYQLLESPYEMIAADVNNSGSITAADLIELQKMILFINEEFTNNTSWRFVEEDYEFTDPTNPFASTFPEVYFIDELTADQIANFIAIKTGDVNGTAIPNQFLAGDTRNTEGTLVLNVEDQLLEAGQVYSIPVSATNLKAVLGYQLSLNFDPHQLELIDVVPGKLAGLSKTNFGFGLLEKGVMTNSWNNGRGAVLEDESILFDLLVKPLQPLRLSEMLTISSDYTRAEAYDRNGQLMEVRLDFVAPTAEAASPFVLYQNQPNPFKDQTIIGFELPQAEEATLMIYGVSGKVLREIRGTYTKGYHQIVVNRSDLPSHGLLYYRLSTNYFSATKKMILLE